MIELTVIFVCTVVFYEEVRQLVFWIEDQKEDDSDLNNRT
jgi:hypothetical protein